ncbi:MAG: hypothetical protein LLG01_18700 [Planctomycetaceae bacterium]|nr:hypothetical protein [Planctomycetaceae bacterium]
MMTMLFPLVLLISKPSAAPSTQPATVENKALAAVMDVRARQIESADKQFKAAVDTARRSRDQSVDNANKTAVRALVAQAHNFTQTGKLAEAITTYKLICRFEPTHPEALATLKAAGISPDPKETMEDPVPPVAGVNTPAAAGHAPEPAHAAAPAVDYAWQRAVQCPVENSQWMTVVQLTEGQSVDFTVTGSWTLDGKVIGPQGIPAEGIVLHGRISTLPAKTFVIEPKCSFKAPVAGLLQITMTMPDAKRKEAKGRLQIMTGIRK